MGRSRRYNCTARQSPYGDGRSKLHDDHGNHHLAGKWAATIGNGAVGKHLIWALMM